MLKGSPFLAVTFPISAVCAASSSQECLRCLLPFVRKTENRQHLLRPGAYSTTKEFPKASYQVVKRWKEKKRKDGISSHTSDICQQKLKQLRGKKSNGKLECPPNSPHCNSLEYNFWDVLKTEVYKDRSRIRTNRIRRVLQRAISMQHNEKAILQFRPHL